MKNLPYILVMLAGLFFVSGCADDGSINIFSIEDDIELGQQLRDQVLASKDEFTIVPRSQNPSAYNYLESIIQDILNSGEVKYAEEFDWEVYLVKDDSTLNAFAAPGGYIFVYTGLIKYLDKKDAFAGVMGHEMGHADRRHSTKQLTKQYGVATMLDILLGSDDNTIKDVLGSLMALKFSRTDETDADTQAVIYLCESDYAANGVAYFFEKLEAEGVSSPPQFLSTHPSPENRIENIYKQVEDRGCDTTDSKTEAEWKAFQASI